MRLKYLGGITPEYQNAYATVPVGGEAEFPDAVAEVMLRDFPGCFEKVETRSKDAPAHDRMKKAPSGKR